jgi:tRNA/tmRNA/rRNA uracil-C5-methylase (TrmA/RlmC/RlmD family)
VTASVRRALAESRVPPYSDQAHAGVARYLQVVVERSSETAQIVLVTNTAERAPLASAFDALQGDLGATLHSLWQNPQLQRTNTILGPTFEHIAGPPSVRETLGGASVFYPPGAFGQNNLPLFERLVSEVQAAVPSQARIVELYAGVGAIGLGLAARSRSITFNELGADSLAGLERGIAALPPEVAARARVVAGSAAEHADLVGGADVVIADPPRRGLDRALIDALAARKPPLFVYVSCDLSTLLPQASELIERGLALRELSLYGLFPFTDHVETVAIFG